MTLKRKITFLIGGLLIFILLSIDFVIYGLFVKIATQNEIELLKNKSEQIIEKIGPAAIMSTRHEALVRDYLPEDSMIRIYSPNEQLLSEYNYETDINLSRIHLPAGKSSSLMDVGDQMILIVKVPVQEGNTSLGTFEIIEKMDSLETNLNTLVTVLTFSTGGAVILGIIGGYFVSRRVTKPISESIQTMQDIESSLTFKKIPSHGNVNDELFKMTETFNRMMSRLEESFHKQQQFVSDASHELNTTLTIIEGYANMLRRWGTRDDKIHQESIDAIYEESKQMRKMTQQLLDLASSQQNDKLNRSNFDLLACCEQAAVPFKKLHSRKIEIHADDDILIYADQTKIKQLFTILIDNALKYSRKSIEIQLRKNDTLVEIRVKDYGIGIPETEIDRVFERFYRVDQSRQRKTGGTGLGLSIAKSIVNEHNGTINIESQYGEGTTLIVQLPNAQLKQS